MIYLVVGGVFIVVALIGIAVEVYAIMSECAV